MFGLSALTNTFLDNYMLTIRPVSQGAAKFVLATMTPCDSATNGNYFRHYLNLIVPSSSTAKISLNGEPVTTANWTQFFNSTFSGAIIDLPDGEEFYRVENTDGDGFLAYLTELGRKEAGALSVLQVTDTPIDSNRECIRCDVFSVKLSDKVRFVISMRIEVDMKLWD